MMSRIIYTSRHERKKQKPSGKKWLRFFATLILVGVVGSAVYAIQYPEWQISRIQITGLKVLQEERVQAVIEKALEGEYIFIFPKRSILLVDSKGLEEKLMAVSPRVKKASVKKEYPDGLTASVIERELWGIFCTYNEEAPLVVFDADDAGGTEGEKKDCVYIDETGFAFEDAPNTAGLLIRKIRRDKGRVHVGEYVVDALLMDEVRVLTGRIPQEIGTEVVGYELFSKIPRELRVETSDGFQVYINRNDNLDEVFRVLKAVLAEEIGDRRNEVEYIDVRFGNKVFYKLK